LFRLFGIDIRIDASWLVIALLIGWSLGADVFPGMAPGLAPRDYWAMATIATVGLFLSIIIHEMAHSLVARRFGVPIRAITLFIFGGVAELEEEPQTPLCEFLTSLAGPVASLILCGAGFGGKAAAEAWLGAGPVTAILWYLGLVNGIVALFNIVPAFPLDGGRVLRAALWAWRGDLLWATRVAAQGGVVFGFVLMTIGLVNALSGDLVGGAWRFLIGFFLRGIAVAAYQDLAARLMMSGTRVAAVMSRPVIAVPAGYSVAALIDEFVYPCHHASFPVVQGARLVGYAGVDQAAALNRSEWETTPVADVMILPAPDDIVDPDEELTMALKRMRNSGNNKLWVVEPDGDLVGVLTLGDVEIFVATKAALGRSRRGGESLAHPHFE
jgi:Zn-dependent protease